MADWKIVDARWYEIFAKASLTKVFKILMKLDEAKGEVRAVDQDWTVSGAPASPPSSLSAEGLPRPESRNEFRHRHRQLPARTSPGVIYDYRFTTAEIKTPLQSTVLANGWRWQRAWHSASS